MATRKEIKEHLEIALKEIGSIKPKFDKECDCWIYSHPNYPVECEGDTKEDVIRDFPKYMQEFIKHRLNDNLDPLTEKETKGRGGRREGAGRPKGTTKEKTLRGNLPEDIMLWFKDTPDSVNIFRKKMFR